MVMGLARAAEADRPAGPLVVPCLERAAPSGRGVHRAGEEGLGDGFAQEVWQTVCRLLEAQLRLPATAARRPDGCCDWLLGA